MPKPNLRLQPLILDLDDSVRGLDGAQTIALADWQEAIRFGCGKSVWKRFELYLSDQLPARHGTVFMGSGDYHHLSHLLLKRIQFPPFDVVVFDNHPDNMRFPFGIHCGSWVRHAAALPQIGTLHVVGISSPDVAWTHAWENHLQPLYRGKVRYWTVGVNTAWTGPLGLSASVSTYTSADALIESFAAHLDRQGKPVYLSIDKDVLAPEVARTNWDQGCLRVHHLERIIAATSGRLIGSDITGEISTYRYRTAWKRWLSALDQQPPVAQSQLAEWQAAQMEINRRLLARIDAAYRA